MVDKLMLPIRMYQMYTVDKVNDGFLIRDETWMSQEPFGGDNFMALLYRETVPDYVYEEFGNE